MMRKLTKKDHEQVFAYLKEEAAQLVYYWRY